MTEKYGLKSTVIDKIRSALARFESIDTAILYGSRAKGNYKVGSDIDLTLKVKDDAPRSLLLDVVGAIDDLDLIYSFDISLLHGIDNENLLDHINRIGVEFYNAEEYARKRETKERAKIYARETYQSEAQLENNLIKRLQSLGYEQVTIATGKAQQGHSLCWRVRQGDQSPRQGECF